jgi:hypothetical protein
MEINDWINKRVKMIADDFGLDQIKSECWEYCMKEYNGMLNLNAMIYRSMEIYAEIIKRSGI